MGVAYLPFNTKIATQVQSCDLPQSAGKIIVSDDLRERDEADCKIVCEVLDSHVYFVVCFLVV